MSAKISVIIPAYNAANYLTGAVQSVTSQLAANEREIIVVDDGSADNTPEIARGLECMFFSQPHQGAATARNCGIRHAAGDYILFLDADDVLRPGAIDALKTPFISQLALGAVFAKAQDFISPELTAQEAKGLQLRPTPYEGVLPGCSLITRETFEKVGLFDTTLNSAETVDWMMRLRELNIPCTKIDFVTLDRRLHLTNTGRLQSHQEMKNYAILLRKRIKRT